jgi:hypothetical protein
MVGRMFNVVVHYEDKSGLEDDMPTVTILAKDDVEAREEAIRMAWKKDKQEYRNDIKKVLYCEINSAGALDGRANKARTRQGQRAANQKVSK